MMAEVKEKQKKANKKQAAQLQNEHTELMIYGRQLRNEINLVWLLALFILNTLSEKLSR
jgi:hypothetical protein